MKSKQVADHLTITDAEQQRSGVEVRQATAMLRPDLQRPMRTIDLTSPNPHQRMAIIRIWHCMSWPLGWAVAARVGVSM